MTHTSPARDRSIAAVIAAASVTAVALGALMIGSAAHAAFVDVPVTGTPGRLVLSSDPYPAEFLGLSPGDDAYWLVDARIENADRAELSLEVRKSGELVRHPRGLTMIIDSCPSPWTTADLPPTCGAGARRIAERTPANDDSLSSPTFTLDPLTRSTREHLLVTLSIEDSVEARTDESLMGLQGDMAVGLTAVAFDPVPPPSPRPILPATGLPIEALAGVCALAVGLLGLGAALRFSRKAAR